eukprot:2434978-Rhodomonas_salina.4
MMCCRWGVRGERMGILHAGKCSLLHGSNGWKSSQPFVVLGIRSARSDSDRSDARHQVSSSLDRGAMRGSDGCHGDALDGDDQGWHRDTPDNKESSDHQVLGCARVLLLFTHSLTHARTHARTHSRTHSLTHARTHAITHSPTHSLAHSLTHTLAHARSPTVACTFSLCPSHHGPPSLPPSLSSLIARLRHPSPLIPSSILSNLLALGLLSSLLSRSRTPPFR